MVLNEYMSLADGMVDPILRTDLLPRVKSPGMTGIPLHVLGSKQIRQPLCSFNHAWCHAGRAGQNGHEGAVYTGLSPTPPRSISLAVSTGSNYAVSRRPSHTIRSSFLSFSSTSCFHGRRPAEEDVRCPLLLTVVHMGCYSVPSLPQRNASAPPPCGRAKPSAPGAP